MIVAIVLIAIAMSWLLYETDFMTARLYSGKATMPEILYLTATTAKPILLIENAKYKPAEFQAMDMPEFSGELNILAKVV